jgi:hypothetical protein
MSFISSLRARVRARRTQTLRFALAGLNCIAAEEVRGFFAARRRGKAPLILGSHRYGRICTDNAIGNSPIIEEGQEHHRYRPFDKVIARA